VVEQLTLNQWVQGSNPCASTSNNKKYPIRDVFYYYDTLVMDFDYHFIDNHQNIINVLYASLMGGRPHSPVCASTKNQTARLGGLIFKQLAT
jgi:hypothetical protein